MPEISLDETRFISPDSPLAELAKSYTQAMLSQRRHDAAAMVRRALDEGVSIRDLYLDLFQPVQYEIGWLWQSGAISVAHEHYCTNATQVIMASFYPELFRGPRGPHRLLAAAVEGELHELGLRMLADFFEMEGWSTDFLGANTPLDGILTTIEERRPDVLAIGVTIYDRLDEAHALIKAVRTAFGPDRVHVLVGGYAFRTIDTLWQKVGADGSAVDAQQAIELATRLVAKGA